MVQIHSPREIIVFVPLQSGRRREREQQPGNASDGAHTTRPFQPPVEAVSALFAREARRRRGPEARVRVTTVTDPRLGAWYHYAWVVVLVAFALQTLGSAVRMAFGTLVEPMSQIFGWGKGTIGLAYALQFIASAFFAPVAGWLGDTYGVRRTLLLGTIIFTLGMTLTGTVTAVWQFYLYYSLLVGMAQAVFTVLLVTSVTYWFKTHQGLATGIVMSAYGVGPVFAAPLIVLLLERMGWGPAMVGSGLVTGLVMVGLALLFYGRPSDKGLLPYGAGGGAAARSRPNPREDKVQAAALFRRIRGSFNFWNLVNIHFLGCVGHSIIIVYAASVAIGRGMDPVVAAGVVSTFAAVSVSTRFLLPVLADRLSLKLLMGASYFLQGATVLLLLVSDRNWQFYLFAVLFGLGYGGEGTIFPLLNRRYYRDAPVGTIYGWQMFGASLGMAMGGWIGGFLYDRTGGYTLTVAVSALASLAGMACIAFLANPAKPPVPEQRPALVAGLDLPAHAD